MVTDFDIEVKYTILCLNRVLMEYFDFYVLDYQKRTCKYFFLLHPSPFISKVNKVIQRRKEKRHIQIKIYHETSFEPKWGAVYSNNDVSKHTLSLVFWREKVLR